ncbi:ABC transporter [Neisseria elongata subsp. glycolytica ATCC 29315]|uniref:Probable ATP-binding protein YheS n=1 Tax=Neisseria elongata subsp. glycolytica ATCC 29315 TaxID=546263 RepID=D4DQ43_NEIEG|nr:ATP-binding cassette domain-containing protein [Neisseria elongata]AJE18723.1 ABC transporter [Neisseria elongata subsp. glycolytica ATCC 29315]EFE49925.1 ABC transporter, ATP-binding protein [Neisseria elongata subsp. glycolytica ATCC 29315]SQH50611.1 ABC transporter ATP-binding protein [Neisseria elongata subsp. glycolytica]
MIEIKNLTLQRGLKVLLEQAALSLAPGRRVGLIGKNGSGKSSLFALLKGEITADKGDVSIPKHWKTAAVAQETPALDISALDYVLQGDGELQLFQTALHEAEAKNDGMKQAEYHAKLEEIDAYSAPARAAKLLSGLGFSQEEHGRPVKSFSGGWRMRLNLAQALMCRADLLLLDEPTNHLDLETVLWLENHLSGLPCTQIIISHDRDFLNATTTQTVELSDQKLTLYGGNYDFYQAERARRLAQQQAAYLKQQAQIKHLQSFIDRFKAKATKAVQAQSRMKALDKLERIAPAHFDSGFSFEFDSPAHLPNPLLQLDKADLGYGGEPVLHGIDLSLESGARYGLLGVNGSGKSTFIKTLAGELNVLSGRIVRSDKLNIGYFAQHQLDTLRPDQSPLWHIQKLSPDVREQEIRNFLGSFNFVGDAALQKTEPFSGGEKARLALAMIVWQKPNLLLLDEPTNHLDLDMRHALTLALQSFQGALIVVSHDRSLLEATTDSFLLIEQGRLKTFDGDLEDYRRYRLAQENAAAAPAASSQSQNRKDAKRVEAQIRQEKARLGKPLQQKISQAEKEIAALSEIQTACEAFLAQEDAYSDANKTKLQQTLAQLAETKVKLEKQEENWLAWQEELEQINHAVETEFRG